MSSLPALPVPRHSEYVSTPPGEGKYLPPRPRPVFARLQRSPALGLAGGSIGCRQLASTTLEWRGVLRSAAARAAEGRLHVAQRPRAVRQPRSHVGQTQAPAARWDGSAPMEPSANGSERAREAETAECAGGGPLLLSRGLQGVQNARRKSTGTMGAHRGVTAGFRLRGSLALISRVGPDGLAMRSLRTIQATVMHLPYRTGFSRTYLPDQGSGAGRISARPAVPG